MCLEYDCSDCNVNQILEVIVESLAYEFET